jgi:hypothetical protein
MVSPLIIIPQVSLKKNNKELMLYSLRNKFEKKTQLFTEKKAVTP